MIESIAQERARLMARLAELDAAEKAAREKQEAIAGRVLLALADEDEEFGGKIRDLLDRNLTKKRERAMFDLSEKPAASSSTPSVEAVNTSQQTAGAV